METKATCKFEKKCNKRDYYVTFTGILILKSAVVAFVLNKTYLVQASGSDVDRSLNDIIVNDF